MGKLSEKVAMVTGASQGIGKAICHAFGQAGAALVINARNAEKLSQAKSELAKWGVPVLMVAGDISQPETVERVFNGLNSEFGQLDVLVNNAGAFDGGPIDELSLESWDRVINTNLRGPFLCTQRAMRLMKPKGTGRIINIGSISAQRVRPRSAPYSTSKFGLVGLTHVTALEGREHGITCGCLHPGNVLSERRVESGKPQDDEPMMTVDELAEVALLMATLPSHVEMLDAVVLPRDQAYIGRG